MSSSSCSSPLPLTPSSSVSIEPSIHYRHYSSPLSPMFRYSKRGEGGEEPSFPGTVPPGSPFHLPSLKFSFPTSSPPSLLFLPPATKLVNAGSTATETEASFYGGKMAAVEAMVCGISRGMRRRRQKKSILQTRCFPLLHIVLCTRRHRHRRQTRRGEGRGKSRLVSWNVF